MDPSAVITQASQAPNDSANQDGSPHLFNNQKDTKKRSNSFLCSIICCLGKKSTKFKGSKDSGGGRRGSSKGSSGGGAGSSDVTDQKQGKQSGPATSAAAAAAAASSSASVPAGTKPLLPEIRQQDTGKKCIVIDLDETLVHSSFKPISNADFIVPVEIDNVIHQVYVLKRPYVDEFLCKVGELFECVLFTASLAKYADPVADLLDKWDVFHSRLFRESCVFHKGNYVKDLSKLGRELPQVIIVDNSPASYIFHPENAIPCASWFDDMNDRELLDLIPLLEQLSQADAVYRLLKETFNSNKAEGGQGALHPSSQFNKKPPMPPPPSSSSPITSVTPQQAASSSQVPLTSSSPITAAVQAPPVS